MNKNINEFEYIANKIIDEKEGIFTIFKANLQDGYKHYYFICENGNNNKYIKYLKIEKEFDFTEINKKIFKKRYLRIIKLDNYGRRLDSFINFCFNYDHNNNEAPVINNKNKPNFCIFLPSNNKYYEFGEECDKEEYLGYYDFIKYLLAYSNIENKYFKEKEFDNKTVLRVTAILDDDITYDLKTYSRNLLFDRINKEKVYKEYYKFCNDVCSMMTNYELILTINVTDNVSIIGKCVEKIRPEQLDWNHIKKNKITKMKAIYDLISNKNFVLGLNITDSEKEEIIKRLDVDHQINMILESMSNEEIVELANKTNNWNAKLNIMKYIHSEK